MWLIFIRIPPPLAYQMCHPRIFTFRLCLLVVLSIRPSLTDNFHGLCPARQIFLASISSFTDDGDLYEALAQMLSKKHVTNTELDLEAISHGDFRDVPQGALV